MKISPFLGSFVSCCACLSARERMHSITPFSNYVQQINEDLFDQPSTNSIEKFCSIFGDKKGDFLGSGELSVQTGMSWEPEGGRVKGNFLHEPTLQWMATNLAQHLHLGRAPGQDSSCKCPLLCKALCDLSSITLVSPPLVCRSQPWGSSM